MQTKKLIDAYNNFKAEPLKTEKEFTKFYVERPEASPSPIEELKDMIEYSNTKGKYLFLGFRGSGKTTELNRLCQMIDQQKLILIHYSIRNELDVSDFDFRDFFASMALKIYETAEEEKIELESNIKKDFMDFMMNATKVLEEEVTKYRSIGASFSKFLLMKLGREAKTREIIRKELETKISDLIQKLNWLIIELENKTNRKVLIIVDDLDKFTRGKQAEDFFYKNYGLLTQPECLVIYTFPIPLAFNPYYENVRHAFDTDIILPQLPVKDREGEKISHNFDFYRDIVKKRMGLDLIEENALEEAILSTGKISEFISVMRESAIKAYRNGKDKITIEEVKRVLEKLRNTYDRTLNEEHKKRLLDIYEKKEARDRNPEDSITRDLLFSLTAVEYEDRKGRWCDINPLLEPLVKKWKEE